MNTPLALALWRLQTPGPGADLESVFAMPLIAQKELRLGGWIDREISANTMRKERKRWGLQPVDFDGLQPLFDSADVAAAKARRLAARKQQLAV